MPYAFAPCPMLLSHPASTGHTDRLTRYVFTFIGNKKEYCVGDIFRGTFPWVRYLGRHPFYFFLRVKAGYKFIEDEARGNRVGRNAVWSYLHGKTSCKCHDACFGRRIMGMAAAQPSETGNRGNIDNATAFCSIMAGNTAREK